MTSLDKSNLLVLRIDPWYIQVPNNIEGVQIALQFLRSDFVKERLEEEQRIKEGLEKEQRLCDRCKVNKVPLPEDILPRPLCEQCIQELTYEFKLKSKVLLRATA